MSISPTVDRPTVTQDTPDPAPTVVQDQSPRELESATPGGGQRPSFTITDAATACAVSRKTITRKLADLAVHGAAKDEDGVWRIPVEALLAVGLHPGRSLPSTPRPATSAVPAASPTAPRAPEPQAPDMVSIPRDRWDDLRIRLARAEAEASERALALADARLALRALTAGPTAVAAVSAAPPTAAPTSTAATSAGSGLPPATPFGPAGPTTVQSASGGAAAAPVTGPPTTGAAVAVPGSTDPTVAQAPPVPYGTTPTAGAGPIAAVQAPSNPDLAAARSHAAQTGGYVPANPGAPVRKRRWWQAG